MSINNYAIPVATFAVMTSTAIANTIAPNGPASLFLGTVGTAAGAYGFWRSLKNSDKTITSLSLSALYGLTSALGVYQIYLGCKHGEIRLDSKNEKIEKKSLPPEKFTAKAEMAAAQQFYALELDLLKRDHSQEANLKGRFAQLCDSDKFNDLRNEQQKMERIRKCEAIVKVAEKVGLDIKA